MKAKIKSYSSPEIDDFSRFVPNDPESFSFLLELLVGPDSGEGEESFDVQICTPKWLQSVLKKEDVLWVNHMFIVLEYDFDRIFNKIKKLVENCTGENWQEVANKVSCIGSYELEEYIE